MFTGMPINVADGISDRQLWAAMDFDLEITYDFYRTSIGNLSETFEKSIQVILSQLPQVRVCFLFIAKETSSDFVL